jgi:ankyrin repeat protein
LLPIFLIDWLAWQAYTSLQQGRLDTALIEAIQEGNSDYAIACLHQGADPNARDYSGSVGQRFKGMVNRLYGKERPTALLLAENKNNLMVVNAVLSQGAWIEARDLQGRSALLNACWQGHGQMVRLLLAKGANLAAKDKRGATALMLASAYQHTGIVTLLKQAGAKE